MPSDPAGLATCEAFRAYIQQLRETWPADAQRLAAARGDEPTATSFTTIA